MKEVRQTVYQNSVYAIADSVSIHIYKVVRLPILKGIDTWESLGILIAEELEND